MDKLLILDHSSAIYDEELLYPFAVEELLCRQVGEGNIPPVAYFWRYTKGLVLGLRDRKLPYAKEAIDTFEREGCRTAVRHSGGAAVPLDEGVVNVSLILQKPKGRIDFHDDFETMASLIQHSVRVIAEDASVCIGEISDSYCPGDFDLSINGQKFCGIAQRRQTRGISVQAFILASGKGEARAKRAQTYYDLAAKKRDDLDYPRVRLGSMASLQELIGLKNETAFVHAVKHELCNRFAKIEESKVLPLEKHDIDEMIAKLKARYAGRD